MDAKDRVRWLERALLATLVVAHACLYLLPPILAGATFNGSSELANILFYAILGAQALLIAGFEPKFMLGAYVAAELASWNADYYESLTSGMTGVALHEVGLFALAIGLARYWGWSIRKADFRGAPQSAMRFSIRGLFAVTTLVAVLVGAAKMLASTTFEEWSPYTVMSGTVAALGVGLLFLAGLAAGWPAYRGSLAVGLAGVVLAWEYFVARSEGIEEHILLFFSIQWALFGLSLLVLRLVGLRYSRGAAEAPAPPKGL